MSTTPDVIEFFPRLERQSRFRLEDFDTLQPSIQQWTVKGLWPWSGVCFIGGPPGSGKSFWTLDALTRVVRGERVLGLKSKPCGVAYVAAEDAAGVRNRIKALRDKTGLLNGAFKMIGQAPNLTDADDVEDLKDTLRGAKADMARNGTRLGIVVIDTLAMATAGADENSGKDMGPVLAALQMLALDLDVVVLVVAHTGKDSERGLRGWSGLMGNADGCIMMNTAEGSSCSGTVTKVKSGPTGQRFAFDLDVVETGRDDDDDEVTSCLVVDREVGQSGTGNRKPKPTDGQALILKALIDLTERDDAETVPPYPGVPPGTKGARRDVLKARAQAMGYRHSDTKAETTRTKINQDIKGLAGKSLIREEDNLIWILPR
jgi:hypothetical protein